MIETNEYAVPTLRELRYILFKEKICPNCGGRLKAYYEIAGIDLNGQWTGSGGDSEQESRVWFSGGPFYEGIRIDRITRWIKAYRCTECHHSFSIKHLIKKA